MCSIIVMRPAHGISWQDHIEPVRLLLYMFDQKGWLTVVKNVSDLRGQMSLV